MTYKGAKTSILRAESQNTESKIRIRKVSFIQIHIIRGFQYLAGISQYIPAYGGSSLIDQMS